MSEQWQLVLDEIPLRYLLSRKPAQRRILIAAFEALKRDPYGDSQFKSRDAGGRSLNIRAIRPFLLTYWLDASVLEVRVVDIEAVFLN